MAKHQIHAKRHSLHDNSQYPYIIILFLQASSSPFRKWSMQIWRGDGDDEATDAHPFPLFLIARKSLVWKQDKTNILRCCRDAETGGKKISVTKNNRKRERGKKHSFQIVNLFLERKTKEVTEEPERYERCQKDLRGEGRGRRRKRHCQIFDFSSFPPPPFSVIIALKFSSKATSQRCHGNTLAPRAPGATGAPAPAAAGAKHLRSSGHH